MANPMYGQNKADSDIDVFGRGKVNVIANGGTDYKLSVEDSGAVCLFDTAAASSFELPAPAAGLEFTFVSTILATSDHVIKTNTLNTDGFLGGVSAESTTAAKGDTFSADADGSNDHMTFDGATTGGGAGQCIKVVAINTENWAVSGTTHCVGSSTATCFGDAQL
jgi:hypothetical protein|tara:strand:+ start:58 stop:552 length:495 start_codon:yes stop_codon:yes gene_type:complete